MAGFTAAAVSYYGLNRELGSSEEDAVGYVVIPNLENLLSRTTQYFTPKLLTAAGPIGTTVGAEWWSAWNYFKYGVGAMIIGSTGPGGGANPTPFSNSILSCPEPFDVVFDLGAPSDTSMQSAKAALEVARQKGDIFAIVGESSHGSAYDIPADNESETDAGGKIATYYGIPGGTFGGTGSFVIAVTNKKNYFKDWNSSGRTDVTDKINLSQDVAALLGKSKDTSPWAIPAGFKRGQIANSISLIRNYTAEEQARLLKHGQSPVVSLPGKGTFFMSNSTAAAAGGITFSRGDIHIVSLLNYIKTTVKPIAQEYLYEPNNEANRAQFTSRVQTILENVRSLGAISAFTVICNASNNTGITFTADVNITPVNVAESITLRVTNNNTSEIFVV